MKQTVNKIMLIVAIFVAAISITNAQTTYQYSVNLNEVKDDQLKITLLTPKVTKPTITFYLPKIVPGTYTYSNFGKYVHNLKAFDKAGKVLPVKQTTDNSWEISKANTMAKIVYDVEDTWDATINNQVFTMAGTNFEAGKNFVFNTFGLFGYLDKMKELPFEMSVTKPADFYGSTGVTPVKTTATLESYAYNNADHFYDSPIMFCKPDTTTVKVGTTTVLVSVYSPNKQATSAYIAKNLEKLLTATHNYLGGNLPVNKYAFIYYFNGEQKPFIISGALEHSYSSFYSLAEEKQEVAIGRWVDMSAHEFFHVVTPLTISSKEVKQFDFNNPVLSKHLWLYEGSTEYDAHHMQVQYGLNTPEQWLKKLSSKITSSRQAMNDTLSFTVMSKGSTGEYANQFPNVYLKGALISTALDLYLLKLSGGKYGLANLKHELGAKYGKDKYFMDDELFEEITKMTYPEIRGFFSKYVEGATPIPYEEFFAYAGVKFTPVGTSDTATLATLGGFRPSINEDGMVFIAGTDRLDAFGKAMGFKVGDELVSINGRKVTVESANDIFYKFNYTTKAGDKVEMILNRKDEAGVKQPVVVTQPAMIIKKPEFNKLEFMKDATPEQLAIRKIWLGPGKL